MDSSSNVIELNQTPSYLSTPMHMIRNISNNKSLLKNLVSRDFKVNYYGHKKRVFLVTVGAMH